MKKYKFINLNLKKREINKFLSKEIKRKQLLNLKMIMIKNLYLL